jgi:hypothetical protein
VNILDHLPRLDRPDPGAVASGLAVERIGRGRYRFHDPALRAFLHARAKAHAAALAVAWGPTTHYAAKGAHVPTIQQEGALAELAAALVPAWAAGGSHG